MKQLQILVIAAFTTVLGCAEITINEQQPIISGKIYVEPFISQDMTTGQILSSSIKAQIQKSGLLESRNNADYILTGGAKHSIWSGDSAWFELKDNNGQTFLDGSIQTATTITAMGKEIAKKIIKKFPKNLKD